MRVILKTGLLIFPIFLTLIFGLLLSSACEAPYPLEVENQTNEAVTIYVNGDPYFDVLPHDSPKEKIIIHHVYTKLFIEGVTKNREIVYSRTFSRYRPIKVLISPSEDNPYLPLEVENRTQYIIWVYINDAQIGMVEPNKTLKKRPLSSDIYTYKIRVETTMRIPYELLNRTFDRSELEQINWHIVIFD